MKNAWPGEPFYVIPLEGDIEGQFSDAEDEPKVNVANLEIKDANTFKASRGGQRGGHGGDQSDGGRGCLKCGQQGHFFNECPNQSSGGDGMDGDIKCKKWVEQGHLSRKCTSKCLNCGRKGHFSRDCLNPICFKCGEEGHFAYKCPSKSSGSCFVLLQVPNCFVPFKIF